MFRPASTSKKRYQLIDFKLKRFRWGWHQFFKSSLLGASCWRNNFSHSLFHTRVILALVSFFTLSDHFLTLDLFLSDTQRMEKISWIPRCRIFLEKSLKKSNILEAHQTLTTYGVAISSHIIYFRFLPISGHFRSSQDNQNWSTQSRKTTCNRRKLFIWRSQKKSFLEPIEKKLFFITITGGPVSAFMSVSLLRWSQIFIYSFLIYLLQFYFW